MMKEILIVPDIHGRRFWERAEDFSGDVIFLGDYIDPYREDGISGAEALEVFRDIITFKAENPDRVTLLIGNHEMQYLDTRKGTSRIDWNHYPDIYHILTGTDTRAFFQVARQVDNYLFTHAGITQEWYKRNRKYMDKFGGNYADRLNALFTVHKDPFDEVGKKRGGTFDYGSPLWADGEEHEQSKPFYGDIIQVVGHTPIEEVYHGPNIWFCDTAKLILFKNGSLRSY